MAKSEVPAQFTQYMKAHYSAYLDDQQSDGGYCDEWVMNLIHDVFADRTRSGVDDALAELIARAGRGYWHCDPSPLPEQLELNLFTIAGNEVQYSYTFPDNTVPGNYRRVIARWATARHVTEDAIIAQAKAEETIASAERKREIAATIMARVGGDPDKLIWNIRDGARNAETDLFDRPSV